MALNASQLGKFIQLTNLVIASINDVSTENTEVYELVLAEPKARIVGSNVTDQGAEMFKENVTKVMVAGSDYKQFLQEANEDEDGGVIRYEGRMKLDISKPRVAIKNGVAVITKAPECWLTAVSFNKKGGDLKRNTRLSFSETVAQLFGKTDETGKFISPAEVAAQNAAKATSAKLEIVDAG